MGTGIICILHVFNYIFIESFFQGIIRYSMPQSSSPAPRRSQAVACGSLLFVSCILKKELDEELAAALGSEGKDADFVATVYRSQAEECLGELWKLMQQSRCFKSNLISVSLDIFRDNLGCIRMLLITSIQHGIRLLYVAG